MEISMLNLDLQRFTKIYKIRHIWTKCHFEPWLSLLNRRQ
jgi:hypothetical protein